jgi:hypothetical protein
MTQKAIKTQEMRLFGWHAACCHCSDIQEDKLMPNVSAGTDVYSVSKVKSSNGTQGLAFSVVLLRGKKTVATVVNEANGGAFIFDWHDMLRGESDEQNRFKTFIESERAKIHDLAIFNGDIWIEEQVVKAVNDRQIARQCKTQTLFQVGAKIGSQDILCINGVGVEVRGHIVRKYAGQKIRFLNDEYTA